MAQLRMLLIATGVALVAALPAHASTPYKVNVTWEGSGGMGRDYTQKVEGSNCSVSDHAVDSSKFHWKVVWRGVRLHLYLNGDTVSRQKGRSYHPKATLAGKYTSETHLVNGCSSNEPPQDCTKTVDFSGQGNERDQTLLVGRSTKGRQPTYQFFVDAQSGVSGGDRCANDTPFGIKTGGYFWTNFNGSDPPSPFNMGALSAFTFIPEHVLAGYGKIVDVIKSTDVKAPPGFAEDCSSGVSSVTCAVSQQWHGTLTIQRAR